MVAVVSPASCIASFAGSPIARWSALPPWQLSAQSADIVRVLLGELSADEFVIAGDIAVHRTAIVEAGAVLKGPLILGAGCLIAAGAYLRGGNWVAQGCTFGPGAELKSSFVFAGTTLAHFNFVGDSVLGADVNLEAGSIVCNHRNERADKEVRVRLATGVHRSGVDKFGALIGDGTRIGANAVIAPGALLQTGTVVRRGAVCDQDTLDDDCA
jgi:NDP-sugar pyrophosphorylase family protein